MLQYIKRRENMSRRGKTQEGNATMEGRNREHKKVYTKPIRVHKET
jgi:hypothetical protein